MYEQQLRALLDYLAGSDRPEEIWHGWHIGQVTGGANNLLFRACGDSGDFAIKFTIRDERDRANREYGALCALKEAGGALAPEPILLDTDSYPQPVVVQTWLPGDMIQTAPREDQEWSDLLEYLATVHALRHATVDLLGCYNNANGAEEYAREASRLHAIAQEKRLPTPVLDVTGNLAELNFGGCPRVPAGLCRADHNVRNFIRHDGSIRSVDWEYSGWGDPAFDIAEMMTHATYMDVSESRWEWVISSYASVTDIPDVENRIRACLSISIAGWLVRIAEVLEGKQESRRRLSVVTREWSQSTQAKYELNRPGVAGGSIS